MFWFTSLFVGLEIALWQIDHSQTCTGPALAESPGGICIHEEPWTSWHTSRTFGNIPSSYRAAFGWASSSGWPLAEVEWWPMDISWSNNFSIEESQYRVFALPIPLDMSWEPPSTTGPEQSCLFWRWSIGKRYKINIWVNNLNKDNACTYSAT